MGSYRLVINATLEGLTDLQPVDSVETPFEYTFKIKCLSCHEEHDKEITINRYELHEVPDTKGEQNFVFRCKNCKRQHHASISRTSNVYTLEDNGKNVAILDIDARGIEPVRFIPNGLFKAKGAETTTKFDEIELDEGEFYDYDDKAGSEVSITEVSWDIVR